MTMIMGRVEIAGSASPFVRDIFEQRSGGGDGGRRELNDVFILDPIPTTFFSAGVNG